MLARAEREAYIFLVMANAVRNTPEVELETMVADDHDELDVDERARLHLALDRADEQLRDGRWLDGEDVIARLKRNTP
ncbi:hypothetical protein [Pendulispora albinea]|uniref:Uncharacterized protein n=1 Tax=Pendulispora albinea TaxID=2741071 RepID=A0ABZ2LQ14_9BACT